MLLPRTISYSRLPPQHKGLAKYGPLRQLQCLNARQGNGMLTMVTAPGRQHNARHLEANFTADPVNQAQFELSKQGQRLCHWVRQQGGYVHPSLQVVENAPCGCRGIVAVDSVCLPEEKQQQQAQQHTSTDSSTQHMPLIAVPEELYMTSADALDILTEAMLSNASSPTEGNAAQHQQTDVFQQPQQQQLQQQMQAQELSSKLSCLQPPLLLALLLAYECSKGPESFWQPYIAGLPDEPPCAWWPHLEQQSRHSQQQSVHAASGDKQQRQQQAGWLAGLQKAVMQLQDSLRLHTTAGSSSAAAAPTPMPSADVAQAAAAAVYGKCSATAQLFGPYLAGVTAADVAWAYGQVLSRAFGAGPDVGLAPLIDMLNHKQGAVQPQHWQGDLPAGPTGGLCKHTPLTAAPADDAAQCSNVSASDKYWVVWSQAPTSTMGAAMSVVLHAGQELFISYVANCDATTAALNFGFVPPELESKQQQQISKASRRRNLPSFLAPRFAGSGR
eukprot:GHRR01004221.1.p1 GENE.GHRR01004221.1~~GHRR01004221.1.p1  ORF type:complete len:501 (+),score=211.42 GHRR01004221.1:164-1666(+)